MSLQCFENFDPPISGNPTRAGFVLTDPALYDVHGNIGPNEIPEFFLSKFQPLSRLTNTLVYDKPIHIEDYIPGNIFLSSINIPELTIDPHKVKSLMRRHDVTQEDIAKKWKMKQGNVSKKINGRIPITDTEMNTLLTILHCERNDIYSQTKTNRFKKQEQDPEGLDAVRDDVRWLIGEVRLLKEQITILESAVQGLLARPPSGLPDKTTPRKRQA